MTPRWSTRIQTNHPRVPIPSAMPVNHYPKGLIKNLLENVDFICATCTSNERRTVYYTLADAASENLLEPISAAPKIPMRSKKGLPYATRWAVYCPVCETVPEDSPYQGFMKGIVDLDVLAQNYPKGLKRPKRNEVPLNQGIDMEEEDAPREERIPRKRGPRKKKSDLQQAA